MGGGGGGRGRRQRAAHEVPGADGAEAVDDVDEDEPRAGGEEVVAVRADGRRRAEQVNRGGAGVVGALGPHRDARELRRVVGLSRDSL
jgi:hypothetical protein